MKELKLNYDGWHRQLNQYVFGESYVRTARQGCNYVWGTVLAVLLAPFSLIYKKLLGRHIDLQTISKYITAQRVRYVSGGILFATGIYSLINGSYVTALWHFGLGSMIITNWKVLNLLTPLTNRIPDIRINTTRIDSVITYAVAKKQSHCPTINWTYKTEQKDQVPEVMRNIEIPNRQLDKVYEKSTERPESNNIKS